jgi:hypothetical protein
VVVGRRGFLQVAPLLRCGPFIAGSG